MNRVALRGLQCRNPMAPVDLRNCIFVVAIAVLSIAADVRSEPGGCAPRFKTGKLRGCFCALTEQDYSECRKGDDESCRYVGECIDSDDPKSTLFWAAIRGNTAEVQRLFVSGLAGRDAELALIAAVHLGRETIVRCLLSQGVSADSKNKHGDTALYLAAALDGHNRLSIVARLLAAGANPSSRNFSGSTPLIAAAYSGQREVAAWLEFRGGLWLAVGTAIGDLPLVWYPLFAATMLHIFHGSFCSARARGRVEAAISLKECG